MWVAFTMVVAAVSTAALYGVASATASSLAATFQPLAPTDTVRMHSVAAAANRASADLRAARQQCRTVARRLRAKCAAATASDQPTQAQDRKPA